jgi:hypothetical protein
MEKFHEGFNMELTRAQEDFLLKRKKLVQSWPFVGTFLLLFLLFIAGWMYFHNPLLVNPFAVAAEVDAASLDPSTLILMAILLPVGILVAFFVLTVLVLLGFGVIFNEKKYQQIIDVLKESSPSAEEEP